ncbi:hypothetical protein [Butyrivibrio sp. FC2001]|uniref:hypothetical protein n=1 Tax=Butyrivibrio sp. FC2001 TaxID=1280671 RepID=UPI00041FB8DB|nr:hypothetical protein [Butyrivibrio sp. FC2001]
MAKRKTIFTIIKTIAFILLVCFVVTRLTYLFRNTSYDRNHITGIKKEKNIDVVCVGASGTFVAWEPFRAWKNYGITSYNLATNAISPPMLKSYVKYAMETQNPDLYIIDLRQIDNSDSDTIVDHEGGLRNGIDSLDISAIRMECIKDCFDYYMSDINISSVDYWSYCFDLAKYHTKLNTLNKDSFKYINNNLPSTDKGFEFVDMYYEHLTYPDNQTDEIGILTDRNKRCMEKLLSFCEDNNLNALFIVSPGWVTKTAMATYNVAEKMVEDRGFRFINCNKYYDEIGLDFSRDFYNEGHCNVYGAEKYTNFMAAYVKEHYNLLDHRENSDYSDWDTYVANALEKDKEKKNCVDDAITRVNEARNSNLQLKEINEIDSWILKADSDQNTILITSKNSEIKNAYIPWKVKDSSKNIIRVFVGDSELFCSDTSLDNPYTATLGTDNLSYSINCGMMTMLSIGEDSFLFSKDGTYITVFDNNYDEVIDVIRIYDDGNRTVMEHL